MARIPAAKASALFEEIIGWPYQIGGSGKTPGGVIDCSGAWRRVYLKYGLEIEHSSNRQYRLFCSRTGAITGVKDLQVGMAVFKVRPWADADRGHRDYGKAPGNVYHVGCVTSVSPLRIVHATPDFAKADTAIGKWVYWGMLKEVDYGGAGNAAVVGAPAVGGGVPAPAAPVTWPKPGEAKVVKDGVRLRREPAIVDGVHHNRICTVPNGTVMPVRMKIGNWVQVDYLRHDGWIRADMLLLG